MHIRTPDSNDVDAAAAENPSSPSEQSEREVAPRTPAHWLSPAILFVLLCSVLGLLCLRIDLYDDSAMLLGARLVRANQHPYLDFYTHYGPLVYTVLARFLQIPANPAFVLRLAQAAFLTIATILVLWLFREQLEGRAFRVAVVPVALLAVSAIFQLPVFLAFFLCLVSLILVAGFGSALRAPHRVWLAAGGGLSLALAALTRPAFAGYVGASALIYFTLFALEREARKQAAVFLAFGTAAFLSLAGLWLLLYRPIPAGTFWRSAVLEPAHLMGGGSRLLKPEFLPVLSKLAGPLLTNFLTATVIFGTTIAWLMGSASRQIRRLGLVASLLAGAVSLLLLKSGSAGGTGAFISLVWFSLGAAVTIFGRREILSSHSLRRAAPFGVASTAFAHYFWARPDRPHLVPLLALAAVAAGLLFGSSRRRSQAAIAALFVAGYVVLWRIPWSPFPAMHLFHGGITQILRHEKLPHANWQSIWPAGELPLDAIQAVFVADRLAGPASRFVAVASNHSRVSGNPILLFLLSRRLPYTKWWAYDPGVQDSPAVQKEMERELKASGSESAVVWPAEAYLFEPVTVEPRIHTEFDQAFQRLYSNRVLRVGLYEIRTRPTETSKDSGR